MSVSSMWRGALLGAVFATDLVVFMNLAREELVAGLKRVRRVPHTDRGQARAWRNNRLVAEAIRRVALD